MESHSMMQEEVVGDTFYTSLRTRDSSSVDRSPDHRLVSDKAMDTNQGSLSDRARTLSAITTRARPSPERFFVTPVCLVPNGRAHLGHVAGPILKADVINRSLKVQGHHSVMISCSDPDELHVVMKARALGMDPVETARHFHGAIEADFRAMLIEFDTFIDPRAPAWEDLYIHINRDLIDRVLENGNARIKLERLPVIEAVGTGYRRGPHVPDVGEIAVGGWIKGPCPFCGSTLVGFFCESCGGHFPHEDVEPKATVHFEAVLVERACRSVYLELSDAEAPLRFLRQMGFNPAFFSMVERYVARYGASIRLTLPTSWGVPYEHPELEAPQVLFTYSTVLFGCHILAGDAYRMKEQTSANPFERGSGIRTILTFGIDNVVPFALGVTALGLGQDRYKPVDQLLPNYFYNLAGEKFSTSRGHVVWAGDIAAVPGLEVDYLRLYLAETAPEQGVSNFDVEAFIRIYNTYAERFNALGTRASALEASEGDELSELGSQLAEGWLSAFRDSYALQDFDMTRGPSMVRRILGDFERHWLDLGSEAGVLLKLGCTLLHPLMPTTSTMLWSALGQDGAPSFTDLSQPVLPRGPWRTTQEVTLDQLQPCLPSTLKLLPKTEKV